MSLSDLFAFTNPYGAPSQGKWNLASAVWLTSKGEAVKFYYETRAGDEPGVRTALDQISDSGGRRLALYEYPYVDGQRAVDLGRKAETYSFNIKFHGPNYQAKYKEFYNKVYLSREAGKLTHPVLAYVRGAIDCRLQSFEPVHRAEEFNAVTFRAVFVEDNSKQIDFAQAAKPEVSTPTTLQNALQFVVKTNSDIAKYTQQIEGLAQTPAALVASINAQKNGIIGRTSALLGKLAATFSSDSHTTQTMAATAGNPATASAGTVTQRTAVGSSQTVNLPPAFAVGLDATSAAFVNSQLDNFVNANQVTTQQAVYEANGARADISSAIAAVEAAFGNDAYDIVLAYRELAVNLQDTVEACITSAQSRVKVYTVPQHMSLRAIAFANGLDPDRSADIESLNPALPSVNLVPRGSKVTVPAS